MKVTLTYILQILLLALCLIGLSYVSFRLSSVTNSLLLYLPLVIGIVFVHWFGWRIIPVLFINGLVTLMIWGVTHFNFRLLLISTHEAAVAFASWLFVTHIFPVANTPRLGNTKSLLIFVIWGIVIPISINSVYVYHYGFVNGNLDKVALYWLSDFITILPISSALLFFVHFDTTTQKFSLVGSLKRRAVIELLALAILFLVLSFLFPFDKYWFIYGIGATLFSLRWGFAAAIILNVLIFLLSYLLPLFEFASSLLISQGSTQYINVHLGMSTMMFVSLLVGRVVTDLSKAEKKLKAEKERIDKINSELQQTNQELDRFVYSVSHDLSAPLKSIKGLVHISKVDPAHTTDYLEKIDKSVNRLEDFISEVLDYSRANRKNPTPEIITLHNLIEEIKSKFEYLNGFEKIDFRYALELEQVVADRLLLRIALSNLISNAIKYQQKYKAHKPIIWFRSVQVAEKIIIEVEDNGEGIKEEYLDKLFTMFYRGTATSTGSGLGLYIAREAIEKLGGQVYVKSIWGVGSTFSIHLPANPFS
ncbi:MAG: hypothetical protein KF856_19270 [Cyclobacteriaceae bacterium]|nr:hypothetical protein [Cyclobacteriaceae bacterium]